MTTDTDDSNEQAAIPPPDIKGGIRFSDVTAKPVEGVSPRKVPANETPPGPVVLSSVTAAGGIHIQSVQSAIDQVAKADPSNIQEVAASQLAIINSYYQSGLQQSQQSFRWSLIWGGIGLSFLLVSVSVLLFQQLTQVALVSGIGGAIVEVFAGTYLYLYKHASDQLAVFRTGLESTQRFLLANSMCEMLEGEIKQSTRAELIHQMVSSTINSQGPISVDRDKEVFNKR